MQEKGLEPLPKYTKHPQPPAGSFRLLFGRAPLFTFTRMANNFMVTDLQKENYLWLNTKKGKEMGIKNGDYVSLENQIGTKAPGKIKVKLTQRIREDAVYMNHGFGVHAKGLSRANNVGIGDDELLTDTTIDPVMGATALRRTFVKIIKGA
jgi:thiosulfate reductase/polysulfide reductase chain A